MGRPGPACGTVRGLGGTPAHGLRTHPGVSVTSGVVVVPGRLVPRRLAGTSGAGSTCGGRR